MTVPWADQGPLAPLVLSLWDLNPSDSDPEAAVQLHPNLGYLGLENTRILATSQSSKDPMEDKGRPKPLALK